MTRSLRVRSPGRVNLIGDHTDYNDGFVLPLAIEPALEIAARTRDDGLVKLVSDDSDDAVEIDLAAGPRRVPGWGGYVHGVLGELRARGVPLCGWEGHVSSTLPVGAGLSSSAALELAVARIATAFVDHPWDPETMAEVGMAAENDWVGVNSGIMDQLAVATGTAGAALLIDCRDRSIREVPMPSDIVVVVLDTMTRRELASSNYDARRADCEEAAAALGVDSLRDVTSALVAASNLPGRLQSRARHVTTESDRTVAAASALEAGDLHTVGKLMYESHASLRDDFEVSSASLDLMVEAAGGAPGVIGARMTGGGFGGAAVALVHAADVDRFTMAVTATYRAQTGIAPDLIVTAASDGTALLGSERP